LIARSLKRNAGTGRWKKSCAGNGADTRGAALRALEITVIYALCAQAKGRVDACGGAADRLVSDCASPGRARPPKRPRCSPATRRAQSALRDRGRDAQRAWRRCGARRSRTDLQLPLPGHGPHDNTVRLGGMVIDVPPGPASAAMRARGWMSTNCSTGVAVHFVGTMIATAAAAGSGEVRVVPPHRAGRDSCRGVVNPQCPPGSFQFPAPSIHAASETRWADKSLTVTPDRFTDR